MAALRCLLLLAVLASVAVAQVSLTVAPQVTCDACAGRSGTIRLGTSSTLTFQSFPEPRLKARYISHYEGVRFGTWWLNKYSPVVVQNQPLDITLYTMDNTANPSRAVEQMDTLVQLGNVDFFIGDQSGDRAVVQFPKAQALRRVIVGSSGAPSAQANNSYAFSVDSREGAASIQAMNLFYSFIDDGSVVAPLPLVVVSRTTSDGADFAAGVKEWLAANPDKAKSFVVSYFTYSSDLLVGMASSDITRLGIQVRDNKIRAIIGQAKSTDQQLIDGVLYNSNLFLDLQAWAYEAIDTTQYNQGVFGYSRWSPDLASASSRTLGALWGQFQSTIHTANADRTVLNQYAVSGFHSVMALAAGIRAANSLENRRVAAALASFNAANPIKSSDSLLIATPGSQFYFSQGQAVFTPLLQQFSCGRVAVPGLVLAPPEAVAGNNKVPYVGGTCYPKQEVIITYENVGEFRLPDRSKNAAAAGPILSIVLIALVALFMM